MENMRLNNSNGFVFSGTCREVRSLFAHLDDVSRNDELGRFSVALFARRPLGTQAKNPLHLVLETLLAGLFIHGSRWRCDQLYRLGLMAAKRKSNMDLGNMAACISFSLD